MKKTKYSGFLLAIYCVITRAQSNPHSLVSLQLYDVPAAFVLQKLAEMKQMNVIIDGELTRTLSLNLQNIEWHQVIDAMKDAAGISIEVKDNLLLVTPVGEERLLIEARPKLNDLLLTLKYLTSEQLVTLLTQQNLLSPQGKIIFDVRQNNVIIRDEPTLFPLIQQWVIENDKPVNQVEIAAHIVTINREQLSELGVNWSYQGKSSHTLSKWNLNLPVMNAALTTHFQLAKISGKLLNLELSALESENQLHIIASPYLLTSHLHTASIKQGTEIPYEVASGANGTTSIEFKQAVLGLEVTPRIVANDEIELLLVITQNTIGNAIKQKNGNEALSIDTQEIKTKVLVKEGETLILGGVFQQVKQTHLKSVPVLSRIPILGSLFSYRASKDRQRELVIFITPRIRP